MSEIVAYTRPINRDFEGIYADKKIPSDGFGVIKVRPHWKTRLMADKDFDQYRVVRVLENLPDFRTTRADNI